MDYAPAPFRDGFKKCKQKLHPWIEKSTDSELIFSPEHACPPDAKGLPGAGHVVDPESLSPLCRRGNGCRVAPRLAGFRVLFLAKATDEALARGTDQ
jgi:hypothetical protein